MKPYNLSTINNTLTCVVFPRQKYPNGLLLTYDSCPDTFDNQTTKIVRYCCVEIIFYFTQDSLYKKTQDWLRYNSSTVLVGPAVLFNILSLFVLARLQRLKSIAKTSTTYYMKCLCVFDTLTIVSKFLYEIIVVRNGLRKHPFVINDFMCKSLSFSESLFAISSIYLLIAMTIDKLLCVLIPLKVVMLLTPSKARFIVTCILFFSTVLSSYNLFEKRAYSLESDVESNDVINSTVAPLINTTTNVIMTTTMANNKKRITYDCDSQWPSLKNDWILLNNIIRVFIPFILLCFCNSWIAVALAKARRNTEALFRDSNRNNNTRKKSLRKNSSTDKSNFKHVIKFKKIGKNNEFETTLSDQQKSSNTRDSTTDGFLSDSNVYDYSKLGGSIQLNRSSSLQHHYKNSINQLNTQKNTLGGNRHISGRASTNQHISVMLLAVSIGFILFNLPFAIRTLFHRQFSEKFKILDYLYQDEDIITRTSKKDIINAIKYEFFSSLTHLLLDLNYIANFFLYFFSGSRFRTQLYLMFKCKKPSKGNINFTNTHFINTRMENSNSNSINGLHRNSFAIPINNLEKKVKKSSLPTNIFNKDVGNSISNDMSTNSSLVIKNGKKSYQNVLYSNLINKDRKNYE